VTRSNFCAVRPQTSLDLNSGLQTRQTSTVDYKIWGLMQERVYQPPIQDVDDLKQRIISVWAEFKQSVVHKAIDQWRPRLRACVHARGQSTFTCLVWQITQWRSVALRCVSKKSYKHLLLCSFPTCCYITHDTPVNGNSDVKLTSRRLHHLTKLKCSGTKRFATHVRKSIPQNTLPHNVQSSPSISTFRHRLKTFLFQQ